MKYKILEATDEPRELAKLVNEALADGWQLQGGVSIAVAQFPKGENLGSSVVWVYAQAMVKETPSA